MPIKAAFFDIDNTLFDYKTMRFVPSTLEAIKEFQANGGKVFVASARCYDLIRSFGTMDLGVKWDGVSAFCGAAAALRAEYTLPEVSQTVILTRMAGRTPVPERERICSLAAHRATMVIFLSTGMLAELSAELIAGGYSPETPAAIVYKASWPEEQVFRCTVADLAKTAAAHGITKTALITVGDFLGENKALSKLYDAHFSTEFREASP